MLSIVRLMKQVSGFRQPSRNTTASMVGARPGDSVLICGVSRPDVAGAVGAVTGLNGQTMVVGRREDAAALVAAAAADAGALVDYEAAPLTMLPFDSGRWDAAVIVDELAAFENEAAQVLSEAVRVLRPGGRLILFDAAGRPGLFGLARRTATDRQPADAVKAALNAAGLRGARLLADVDGVRYFEAVKPREIQR